MKESMWGVLVVMLGLMGISALSVIQTVTTTGTHDYYLLREVTEAAMFDSLDLGYYRREGNIKIVREKFIENFLRRFSESVGRTGTREIVFYDVNELPPKVSIGIDTGFEIEMYEFDDVQITTGNIINAILETKY